MKKKSAEPKKEFRRLTEEELRQVTGGSKVFIDGEDQPMDFYKCDDGRFVLSPEDCQ